MKPPTFFLSSTIYDFKDLRSAIKYHLERQGYRVLASEFNDFSKPLDTHSYEACLRAIHQADWFILLIGTRVGGWYDEAARVSITQQEYREAYRLHQQGRLKLLTFVRGEVWQAREERKQLSRHLDGMAIDAAVKAQVVNYPSKSAADAEFITAFIDEVGRNRETLAARAGGGPLPTGNWIHVFDSFQQVVEAIQLHPFADRPVEEMALRQLLRRELREMLRNSLVKVPGRPAFSPRPSIDRFHAEHVLQRGHMAPGRCRVVTESFDQLCSLSMSLLNLRHHPRVLWRAIESSAFLRLDPVRGTFDEEPVYGALLRLADELRAFEKANSQEGLKVVFDNTPRARPHRAETIDVELMPLVIFLHLMDRWCNIIESCSAIIRYLDGNGFTPPPLRPRSPVGEVNDDLHAEDATDEDVDRFLGR